MENSGKLRVFFLEDNPDDVELEIYELQKTGVKITYDVAKNRKTFFEKLPAFDPDIILADYSLPDINGIEAIELCKQMNVDVPVIFITGEGNEQIAVDSLRLGAIDYIIKRNISGLYARVTRALEIWSDRKAKERAEAEEKRLQQLLLDIQKMETIGKLTGGIAHDFNNILTGIVGFLEICLDDVSQDSELYNKLQTVSMLCNKGAELVKQLLTFSSKIPMELKVIDLNSFIRENMQFMKHIVEDTVKVRLELPEESFKFRCYAGQFTQVLMNLILNARDAMGGKGSIEIKSEKCSLTDDFQPAGPKDCCKEYICLSISDTGAGINNSDVKRIFEPFFTTKEKGKGTGLGLSIVDSIVTAHGGKIKVFSEKGSGTTFDMYLPLFSGEEGIINNGGP